MLSLPLVKLSVAQDAGPSEQKFTWLHEAHDLTFVLDSYGARNSAQRLKVVQGTQVLQLIELEQMISQGDELVRSMQAKGTQLKAEQLPVSAIVRCPLLAIRWQLPSNKIRRAQLKFKSNEDFSVAYQHLRQLGLRMTSSSENQACTQTPGLPNRASKVTPSPTAAVSSSPTTTGSLSCPPSRLADISTRPYSATNALTSVESQVHQGALRRPTSALTDYQHGARALSRPFSGPLKPPVYFPRPVSATSDALDQAVFPHQSKPVGAMENVEQCPNARPETAMLFIRPSTAEALLPPKRELPFQRSPVPSSSGSDSIRPHSRPSTGLMGPPPLPARVTSLRPGSSRTLGLEYELAPLPQPTVMVQSAWQSEPLQQSPGAPDQDPESRVYSINSSHENSRISQPWSSPPASSPVLLERASHAELSSSRSAGLPCSNAQILQVSKKHSSNAKPNMSSGTYQDPTTSERFHTSCLETDENLAAYALQPKHGRRDALNNFIFRHLESDDFLTLIEDMETCWARVAFDM